ncbi:MAG: hypothetical protein RXP98_05575 [Thermoplasmata archaeon]
MRLLVLALVLLLLVPSFPMSSSQSNNTPVWFFQGAYLNYTNVIIQNSSKESFVNVSYKILSINGIYFTYQVTPGELKKSNYTVDASLNDLNGFPAINSTELSMLNKGNASFLRIIKLPFTYVNVTVKTNIMAYTSEGVISSDLVIVRITSSLVKNIYEVTYTNYSTYSGVLLNMKIIFGNQTKYVSNLVSTNVPLGILTWPQIIAEIVGFVLIIIIVIYFLRRYRRLRVR